MKKLLSYAKFGWLLPAFGLMLSIQSCQKESEVAAPSAGASSSEVTAGGGCRSVCLVAGQHTPIGTVDVAKNTSGGIDITYNSTAPNYLREVHLDIFTSTAQLKNAKKLSGGGAIPGKFAFSRSFTTDVTSTTFSFTLAQLQAALGTTTVDCFYIAAHAAVSTGTGETAWAGACTGDGNFAFDGANWGTYFQFCMSSCDAPRPVRASYAWEDLASNGNDADYNDLVIESNNTTVGTTMTLQFTAVARGSSYDHAFRFRIPNTGATVGGSGITSEVVGGYRVVTVFPSTIAALPPSGPSGAHNTVKEEPCNGSASASVTITGNLPSLSAIEPFISVYTDPTHAPGTVGAGTTYDLYVKNISPSMPGTFIYRANPNDPGYSDNLLQPRETQEFPNGIVTPADWKYPQERVAIFLAYPNSTSITAGFNLNWAAGATNPLYFFNCPGI